MRFLPVLVALAVHAGEGGVPLFPLERNDVVHVLGDSTTVEGAQPTGYITLLQQAVDEQRKEDGILFVPQGRWGAPSAVLVDSGAKGGEMSNALKATTKDGRKATAIIINYGLNDSKSRERGVEPFAQNLRACVAMARAAKVRLLLCTPMTWNGLEQTRPYAQEARRVAAELAVPLVDLYAVHAGHIERNTKDGTLAPGSAPTKDGVHLSSLGNLLTASALLEAMGLSGARKSYRVVTAVSGPNRRVTVAGTVVLEPAKDAYAPGEQVTVRAVPDAGYRFVEWRDGASGSDNPLTISVGRPLRLHALLEPVGTSAPPPK